MGLRPIICLPCECGHTNRPGRNNVGLLKLWMTGDLPPCVGCRRKMNSLDIMCPWSEKSRTVQTALSQLKSEGKKILSGLVYRNC